MRFSFFSLAFLRNSSAGCRGVDRKILTASVLSSLLPGSARGSCFSSSNGTPTKGVYACAYGTHAYSGVRDLSRNEWRMANFVEREGGGVLKIKERKESASTRNSIRGILFY